MFKNKNTSWLLLAYNSLISLSYLLLFYVVFVGNLKADEIGYSKPYFVMEVERTFASKMKTRNTPMGMDGKQFITTGEETVLKGGMVLLNDFLEFGIQYRNTENRAHIFGCYADLRTTLYHGKGSLYMGGAFGIGKDNVQQKSFVLQDTSGANVYFKSSKYPNISYSEFHIGGSYPIYNNISFDIKLYTNAKGYDLGINTTGLNGVTNPLFAIDAISARYTNMETASYGLSFGLKYKF